MSLGFEKPTKFGLKRLLGIDYNDTTIKGNAEDSTFFDIHYKRLSEKDDYLNAMYR